MSTNQFFAAAFALAFVAGAARAQSEASTLSQVASLPIASAVVPTAFSAAGGAFVVRSAQAGAFATTYTLERVSDGAHVSVEITMRGATQSPVPAGGIVTAKRLSTGVVLAAGDEPFAFAPNALGRALMRDVRIAA
jgi:hypothetical protein